MCNMQSHFYPPPPLPSPPIPPWPRLQYYSEGPSGSTATVASAFSVQLQEPFPPTPTQGRKGCYNLKKTITVSQVSRKVFMYILYMGMHLSKSQSQCLSVWFMVVKSCVTVSGNTPKCVFIIIKGLYLHCFCNVHISSG